MKLHLPIIVLLVFLFSGLILSVIKDRKYTIIISIFFSLIAFFFSVKLYSISRDVPDIEYLFGNFSNKVGIGFKINEISALFGCILTFVSLLFQSINTRFFKSSIISTNKFLALVALLNFALLGITYTDDLFNAYVFIEIAALCSYGIAALSRNNKSMIYAFNYLVYGTISACLYLLFIAFIYASTGYLNMTVIATKFFTLDHRVIFITKYLFIGSIFIKAGFFPFHFYLRKVYEKSSSLVAMYLSALNSGIYIYFLLRVLLSIYKMEVLDLDFKFIMQIWIIAAICYFSYRLLYSASYTETISYISVLSVVNLIIAGLYLEFNMTLFITIFAADAISKLLLFGYAKDESRLNSTPLKLTVLVTYLGVPPSLLFFAKWQMLHKLVATANYIVISIVLACWLISFLVLLEVLIRKESKFDLQPRKYGMSYYITLLLVSIALSLLGVLWK